MADEDPANGDSPHRDSNKSGESPGTSSEALVEEITQKVLATIKKKSPMSQDEIPPTGDSISRHHSGGVDAGTPGTSRAEALADEITRKVLTAIQKKTSTPQGEEFLLAPPNKGVIDQQGLFLSAVPADRSLLFPRWQGKHRGGLAHHCQGQAPHRALHLLTPGAYVTGSWAHLCQGQAWRRALGPLMPGASTLLCLVPVTDRGKHRAVPCVPLIPGASTLLCLVPANARGKHALVCVLPMAGVSTPAVPGAH